MTQDTGVPAAPSGHSPSELSQSPLSQAQPSVPNAVANLRENAEGLIAWTRSFDQHTREVTDPLFGRRYGIEEQVRDLFNVTSRFGHSIYQGLLETASGLEALHRASIASAIEAASAGETRSGSTEGESAIGAAETPKEHGHDQ